MSNRDVVTVDEIIWEDPPARVREKRYWSKWALVAEQLRKNPGQWAKLPTRNQKNPRMFSHNIKNGTVKAWQPKGAFEAAYDPDTSAVFARYVGEEGS